MAKVNATVGHVVFLLKDYNQNIGLFRKLIEYFDYAKMVDEEGLFGVMGPNDCSVWFLPATDSTANNRDSYGLNHLGFHVEKREDVDTFVEEFLRPNGIEPLFETPKDRPEFAGTDGNYYQVMFELPGTVLFEVVYTT